MGTNHPLELNRAVPGGRVEMFAIPNDDYPGGWFYRFQYYQKVAELEALTGVTLEDLPRASGTIAPTPIQLSSNQSTPGQAPTTPMVGVQP